MMLLAVVSATSAQEQEPKLVDRLLKPNMSLVNSAHDKRFKTGGFSTAKRAPIQSFSTPERAPEKSFATGRAFPSKLITAPQFPGGGTKANTSARSQLAKAAMVQVVSAADGARVAPESGRNLTVASFAGNRPFLGQGKSQKALSAQDTPLTIEQVRELLNKNK